MDKRLLEAFPSSMSFSFPRKSLAVIVLALENKTYYSSGTKNKVQNCICTIACVYFFFLACVATMRKKILSSFTVLKLCFIGKKNILG